MRSGKAINKYKDRSLRSLCPLERVKLCADRNSGGAVKWLELLPSSDQPITI
jgi:hypothetical protein